MRRYQGPLLYMFSIWRFVIVLAVRNHIIISPFPAQYNVFLSLRSFAAEAAICLIAADKSNIDSF